MDLLFPDSDKGLGPCAVEFSQYVGDALDQHLLNPNIYTRLTEEEAFQAAYALREMIHE